MAAHVHPSAVKRDALRLQKAAFLCHTRGEAGQGAIGGDDTMARDNRGKGVAAKSLTYGPISATTEAMSDGGIGCDSAGRNPRTYCPNHFLKTDYGCRTRFEGL